MAVLCIVNYPDPTEKKSHPFLCNVKIDGLNISDGNVGWLDGHLISGRGMETKYRIAVIILYNIQRKGKSAEDDSFFRIHNEYMFLD